MSVIPDEAKYTAPQQLKKSTRRRRRFDIYGGLAGGSASLTSRLTFDLVSNETLDLSTLTIWVETTGYNTNHCTVRPKCLFDFLEVRSNSTTIESLRHLDELENLHYILNNETDKNDLNNGGWGFKSGSKDDAVFEAIMTNAKNDGTIEPNSGDPTNQQQPFHSEQGNIYSIIQGELEGTSYPDGTATLANHKAGNSDNIKAFNRYFGQLRYGHPLAYMQTGDNTGTNPFALDVTDANSGANAQLNLNQARANSTYIPYKCKTSGFLNQGKLVPSRLLGKLQLLVGVNADKSKILMVTVPNSVDTFRDEQFVIKNAYVTCDEISFDESWWNHTTQQFHNHGMKLAFNTFSTQTGNIVSNNSSYSFVERKLYLNYFIWTPVDQANQRQALDTRRTKYDTMMRHFCERRRDDGTLVSRLTDYDILLNGQSHTDGEIVIFDSSRPLLNEAYNELQKVVKGVNKNDDKMPISMKSYMHDKFMIGALFSPNMNDLMDDDVIDAINNTTRLGDIVLRTKGVGMPEPIMPNYFMATNFTAILHIKGHGHLSVES